VLLREIVRTLRKKHVKTPDAVAITASTGTYESYLHAHLLLNVYKQELQHATLEVSPFIHLLELALE